MLVIFGLIKSKRKMAHELITTIKPINISKKDAFLKLFDKYLLIIGFISISIGYVLTILDLEIYFSFNYLETIYKILIIVIILIVEGLLALGVSLLSLDKFHKYANLEAKNATNTIWMASDTD